MAMCTPLPHNGLYKLNIILADLRTIPLVQHRSSVIHPPWNSDYYAKSSLNFMYRDK